MSAQELKKLGYKEYLVTLKYSALKFMEYYGPEQEIEVFYDTMSKNIVSIIQMPYRFQIKSFKTTLAAFVIYVTTLTNPHLDKYLIIIRLYRYFYMKTKKEFAKIIGCTEEEYERFESGIANYKIGNDETLNKLNILQINNNILEGVI